MVNVNKTRVGVVSNPSTSRSLPHWVREQVNLPDARVRSRLRGNNLHLLFECDPCPEAEVVISSLRTALTHQALAYFLPAGSPQVYRVVVYGRTTTENSPQWTESFELHELGSGGADWSEGSSPAFSSSGVNLSKITPSAFIPTESIPSEPMPDASHTEPSSPEFSSTLNSELNSELRSDLSELPSAKATQMDASPSLRDSQSLASQVLPPPLYPVRETVAEAEALPAIAPAKSSPDPALSVEAAAQQGHPAAIAHYLRSILAHLGIAIRARSEPIAKHPGESGQGLQRLIILCEAAYIPEPLQLVEDLAKQLRALDLQGFREALVFGQVRGEAKPEWVLRVDLTPPERLLREWARWGDVQAIVRLLNRALRAQNLQVSALLKDVTLHLTCAVMDAAEPGATPNQATAIAILSPLLESLTPQGLHGVALYGVATPATESISDGERLSASESDTPQWVHWIDLPATRIPALTTPTLTLAQQGNVEALAFLLNRLLNPELDRMLTTGGVRAQVRRKLDVLHVMTDALNCPPQKQVARVIGKFVQPLQIPEVVGIRVYGRKAGQKLPLWSQSVDFVARGRLVPQATPEFAASDAYVGDLLTPAGPLTVYADANAPGWYGALKQRLEAWQQQLQRSLVHSQIFVPLNVSQHMSQLAIAPLESGQKSDGGIELGAELPSQRQRLALVWSAIGVLLVVQSDWLLGRLLQPQPVQPKPLAAVPTARSSGSTAAPLPSPSSLPKLILRKSKPADVSTFNDAGFTKPGESVPATPKEPGQTTATAPSSPSPTALKASPLLPKAPASQSEGAPSYPTFNSRQLDEKLALYQQYMAENGGAPEVLVVGSSRALRGVDPAALRKFLGDQGNKKVRVFNFGINGATAQVVNVLIQQMLPPEALPKLIIWADGARAFNSGREDVTFNAIAASPGFKALLAGKPPIPGTLTANNRDNTRSPVAKTNLQATTPTSPYAQFNQLLDQGVGRWFMTYPQRDRLKIAVRDQLAAVLPKMTLLDSGHLAEATSPGATAANAPGTVLSAGQDRVDINGFLPLPNQFNPVTYYQKYAKVNGDFDSDYEDFGVRGSQADALLSLAQFSRQQQIALVFVNLPLTEDYLDSTRRRYEEEFQRSLLQLSMQQGFTYRDLSASLLTQNQFFSDPSHLNRYGGYEVARRLAQDVMIPWNKTR